MQNGSSLAVLKDTLSPLCGPQRLFIKTAHTADMHSLSCCYSGNSYKKKKKSSRIRIYCLFFENKVSLFHFLKSEGYLNTSSHPSPSRIGSGCSSQGLKRFGGLWKAPKVSSANLTSFRCRSSAQVRPPPPTPSPVSLLITSTDSQRD